MATTSRKKHATGGKTKGNSDGGACASGGSAPKKAKREQKFLSSYSKDYPCIVASKIDSTYARCTACESDFRVSHGGITDVIKHVKTVRHVAKASALKNTTPLGHFLERDDKSADSRVIRAEAMFTAFLVEHNVPLAASDHAGRLFRSMFPNNDIAGAYSCARTKTAAIVKELGADSKAELAQCMQRGPFVLGADGSQEGEEKYFPIVVSALDPQGNIKTELLSVPTCETSATGENIFGLLDSELKAFDINWKNCLAFVTDNVMVGSNKGVISYIRSKHPKTFLARCVCHLLSLTVKKAIKESSKFDLDDIMRQLSWYLSKSTGRQQRLKEIQKELGLPDHKIVDHVPTRWLSLGAALDRALELWKVLEKFFKEECTVKASEASSSKSGCDPPMRQKLRDFFRRRTTKLYVLFYAQVLEMFNKVNKLEQTDNARIHLIKRDLEQLYRRLLVSFLKPAAMNNGTLMEVDFNVAYNIKRDEEIFIGSATRQHLGSVDNKEQKIFMENVKTFYKEACKYMQEKVNPAKETLWKHAEVADVSLQSSAQVSSLQYFLKKFPCILPPDTTPDELETEFLVYQTTELPPEVTKQPSAELQWKEIGSLKDHNGATPFTHLSRAMLSILLIPVSNCGCERIFSQVRRNKTDFRASLGPQTLDALMVLKSRSQGPCYQTQFSEELLKKCKSATKRQQSGECSTSTSQ